MKSSASCRPRLLGAEVDPVTPREMLDTAEAFMAGGGTAVIANHNLHSLALCRKSPEMRAFFEDADLVQIDSMPLIAWGWLMGRPVGRKHRSTYLDWREDLWRRAQARGWRVFYLGGEPGVAAKGAEAIAARWPGVDIQVRDGYFDATEGSADNEAVITQIADYDPDVILVGMGMPRQEAWIQANRDRIDRGVFFAVGAAFDYEAGVQATAPRWMGQMGVEWLFRLVSQPKRLAHRYLVEPWALLPAALGDVLSLSFGGHVRRDQLGIKRSERDHDAHRLMATAPAMSCYRDTAR